MPSSAIHYSLPAHAGASLFIGIAVVLTGIGLFVAGALCSPDTSASCNSSNSSSVSVGACVGACDDASLYPATCTDLEAKYGLDCAGCVCVSGTSEAEAGVVVTAKGGPAGSSSLEYFAAGGSVLFIGAILVILPFACADRCRWNDKVACT